MPRATQVHDAARDRRPEAGAHTRIWCGARIARTARGSSRGDAAPVSWTWTTTSSPPTIAPIVTVPVSRATSSARLVRTCTTRSRSMSIAGNAPRSPHPCLDPYHFNARRRRGPMGRQIRANDCSYRFAASFRSHYTRGVGDEKQARAALADLQARLARSPYDALHIEAGTVGTAEIRAAFLQLTKTYHPAKFARMSSEVQKLANEVFLGLRAAHDILAKPRTPLPTSVRQSGTLPALQRPGDSGARMPAVQSARPVPAAQPPTRAISTSARPPTAGGRSPTPAIGVPVANGTPGRPTTPSSPFPASGARPPTAPASAVPASGARSPTPPRPTPAMDAPARPGAAAPARPAAAVPSSGARPTVEPELAGIYDLLHKQQWQSAHAALAALVALAPDNPRYRALVHYARGREAQLSRKLDDARVELHEALQLDPDLPIAKTALAELFTRRK